jgi:hypothetical protein
MSDEKPKTGTYRLGSAFIWAAAQGSIAWFAMQAGLWKSIGAGFGGLVAGWVTAALLGRFAKWGAGSGVMAVLGLVFGVAVASGAVTGLSAAINWYNVGKVDFGWDSLGRFVLSTAAVPAAVLGLLTGLYVRSRIPRPAAQ